MLFDDYRASVIGYISAANITQNIGFRKKPLLPRRETVCEVSTLSWSPQSLVYQGSSGGGSTNITNHPATETQEAIPQKVAK